MERNKLRTKEIEEIQNKIDNCAQSSLCITVYGNSGTGKTSLVQEAIEKYFDSETETTILYINLLDDILSSTAFWDIILFTTWYGNVNDKNNMLKISKKLSLSTYLRKNIWGRILANALLQSVSSIVATIPFYNAQLEVGGINISENQTRIPTENNLEKSQIVSKYLKYIAKKGKLVIILDNYQFMNHSIRNFFESSINQISKNCTFINIQRVDQTICHLPLCYAENQFKIELLNLSRDELQHYILQNRFPTLSIINEVTEDCYTKTSGNLKEIDLYLRANGQSIEKGILKKNYTKSLSNSLNSLPQIQRELILLATLFPAGIRLEYVTNLMKKFFYLNDEILTEELRKIITLGYVMLNSSRNDLLKPAHDKINLSIETINSTEEFLEFYSCVENGLTELVQQKQQDSDYIYLLHCYIGICDSQKLLHSIEYLEELIHLEYDDCSFLYLVELANEYIYDEKNVILHLSSKYIVYLLDACQKTCSFKTSLAILDLVRKSELFDDKFCIYYVKVLTQLYRFNDALEEVNSLPISTETLLYKLIILEHLGKDEEAKDILDSIMLDQSKVKDKWYYIIMRNTAHYYTYDEAFKHLTSCEDYFDKCGTVFEQATILNNIAVIQIWNGAETFTKAEKNLRKAIQKFQTIGSNEIFEAYYNFGVLWYLKGNPQKAIDYCNYALEEVPTILSMDVTLLNLNRQLCECSLNPDKIQTLERFLLKSLNTSEILQDPWVRFQLEYNLKSIEIYLNGNSTICLSNYYLENPNNTTAFTVFSKIRLYDYEMPVCFSLSPNWRY